MTLTACAWHVTHRYTRELEAVSGGAKCGCGTSAPTVVIGVLSQDGDKGLQRRKVLRDTWMRLAPDKCDVVIKFIMQVTPGVQVPPELARENDQTNDLLFLPVIVGNRKGYSGGKPSNLLERVQAFMRWVTVACHGVQYVLKSDDDCYVAADKLVERIKANEFPKQRLYFGHFLGGMAAKNKQGKPDSDNYMKLDAFPKYAGAGYLLTANVAAFVGDPGLPFLFHRVEDRGLGVMLSGFNVTYLNGRREFQPWGNCFDNRWVSPRRAPGVAERGVLEEGAHPQCTDVAVPCARA